MVPTPRRGARADRASRRVRRLTGGGAIHHQHGSPSLTAPVGLTPRRHRPRELRARARSDREGPGRGGARREAARGRPAHPDAEATGMCSTTRPRGHRLGRCEGRGVRPAGAGGRVLHHGSIKLGTTSLEGPTRPSRPLPAGHAGRLRPSPAARVRAGARPELHPGSSPAERACAGSWARATRPSGSPSAKRGLSGEVLNEEGAPRGGAFGGGSARTRTRNDWTKTSCVADYTTGNSGAEDSARARGDRRSVFGP